MLSIENIGNQIAKYLSLFFYIVKTYRMYRMYKDILIYRHNNIKGLTHAYRKEKNLSLKFFPIHYKFKQ